MHAIRYLPTQLLLQVLHRDEYWEAAIDVAICCKKSFPIIAQGDNSSAQDSAELGSQEKATKKFEGCLNKLRGCLNAL
jgi:DNA polymerase phi